MQVLTDILYACQGHQEGKPGNVSMKYDIEPLPAGVTPEQRFFEGGDQLQTPLNSDPSYIGS